jgi:CIC family chloride channel protein
MTDDEPPGRAPNDDERTGLVLVCALAALSGMAIGFVGGAFRRLLIEADGLRHELVDWAHSVTGPSWLVPILV